jgi:TRAP-type C4-dicarboxylate transport system substrate-binding protein
MRRLGRWVAILTSSAVLAACGTNAGSRPEGPSRAAPSAPAPSESVNGANESVVLSMANAYAHLDFTPAIAYFASRVEKLSGGDLRIEVVHEWGHTLPNAEQEVVRGVSEGEVDLGRVGARVFDTLGTDDLQALQAPMLIDSYPLQDAAINGGITDEMLQGLDAVGVARLGVLADGLRKPIAVDRPLQSPEDYRGITFETFRSEGQFGAIRALGDATTDVWGPALTEGLERGRIQAFEKNLLVYQMLDMDKRALYVTANVNLRPRMDVLFANPERVAELTDQQRGWLEQAAADAVEVSVALIDRDDKIVAASYESGAHVAVATKVDLRALRDAFVPAYAELARDPETRAFIEQIEELKALTPGSLLTIPAGCERGSE